VSYEPVLGVIAVRGIRLTRIGPRMLILGAIEDEAADLVHARIGRAVGTLDVRHVVVTFDRTDPGQTRPFRAEVRLEVAGRTATAAVAGHTRAEAIEALADGLARQLVGLTAPAQKPRPYPRRSTGRSVARSPRR
jgi:ribosome-associated translation inhibitor RaiA